MKLIHLGDLHIGKSLNEFSLIEDQKYILNEIINLIDTKGIDGVILAGDIYDRTIPSEEAVKVLDNFFTKLASMGKMVFAVSGNHDSDERLNYGSKLFEANNIYIAGKYNGETRCIDVEDEHGMVHVWLMPYVKVSRVAHYFPDEKIENYDAAFKTVINNCNVNVDERNIIVTHQFVTSASSHPELAGSETGILNVGTIDRVSAECFDDFDYVAMGHIHSAQAVGRETCRYSGSLLKYSLEKNELNREKTIPIITLGAKGDVQVELTAIKPLRDIRHIRGNLQDLINSAVDTEDYIFATLTDEETQFDAKARLQEVYPYIMKLNYDNKETRAFLDAEKDIETEGKSFHELVTDFFTLFHGAEPTENEWAIIEEVAKEAGVIE